MRGVDVFSEQLFTVKRLDDFVPASHPLHPVREMVNQALRRLDGLFERIYEPGHKGGCPSVAPEKLARRPNGDILTNLLTPPALAVSGR